eukprot:c23774_g3_i2 orf=926-1165(-)
MEAYNMKFLDEGNGGFSAHTHMSTAADAVHMDEVALVMDDPCLDYINKMLVDKVTEDRTCATCFYLLPSQRQWLLWHHQ